MELEKLKYPIGKCNFVENAPDEVWDGWTNDLGTLPAKLDMALITLNKEQINTPYRPGGWTVKQVVHHLADSHMNAYCRIKLSLTQTNPTINPYDEAAWADLGDYKYLPINLPLALLRALHPRMVYLFKRLTDADKKKTYTHPEYGKTFTMESVLALYAWHGNHHLAHITSLKKRNNWK